MFAQWGALNEWVVLAVLFVATVWVLYGLQRHFFIFQYLYFLRFPILTRVVLVVLPCAMLWVLPEMLGNLAIATPAGAFLISMLATWTALIALFTSNALVQATGSLANLDFVNPKAPEPGPFGRFVRWLHEVTLGVRGGALSPQRRFWRLLLHGVWGLGIIAVVVIRSGAELDHGYGTYIFVTALGFTLAVVLPHALALWSSRLWSKARARRTARSSMRPPGGGGRGREAVRGLRRLFEHLDPEDFLVRQLEEAGERKVEAEATARRIKVDLGFLALFFALTLGLYAAGYRWLGPDTGFSVPPLALVLVLVVLWSLLLAGAAGALDVLRVPTVVLLFAVVFLVYQAADVDHHYEASVVGGDFAGAALDPLAAYRAWRDARGAEEMRTLVVVTASGGGITASLWTAEVLARLQEREPRFGRSLVLVSSVSGGGVGAMYFVGGYRDGAPPGGPALAAVRAAARASSLSATVWGLAYLDFWRFLWFSDQTRDRGWALERTWANRLRALEGGSSLRSWREDAARGLRPVQVFNATIAETGQRFLLGSMNLPGGEARAGGEWQAINFLDLYEDLDIAVPTAARLSATFPFVSPIARIEDGLVPDDVEYHLADGGYYDNHGVITAIDFLRTVLPEIARERAAVGDPPPDGLAPVASDGSEAIARAGGPPTRVVIVQVRTPSQKPRSPAHRSGFKFAIAGPAITLNNVRGTSQISRNDVEIALLHDAWCDLIPVETAVFELAKVGPLSWHLTAAEVESIQGGWASVHERELNRVAGWLTPRDGADAQPAGGDAQPAGGDAAGAASSSGASGPEPEQTSNSRERQRGGVTCSVG